MRTTYKLCLFIGTLFLSTKSFAQVEIQAAKLVARGIVGLVGGNKEKKQEKVITNSSSTTKMDGKNVTILRVKDADIKSKAKTQIIKLQEKLDEYAELMKANAHLNIPKKDSSITNIQTLDPDWPVEYYEAELKAYKRYELKLQQKEIFTRDSIAVVKNADIAKKTNDSLSIANKPVADSAKPAMPKPVAYSYINKAYAIVKASPTDDAKTLGVLYVGSYVKPLGTVDKTIFVKISVNGVDGYIDKNSLVDNIDKITVPNADLPTYKKSVYYKYVAKPQ